MIYGVWFGGPSYTGGDIFEDRERFTGITHAGSVLREREGNGGWRPLHFEFVNKPAEDSICPVVEGSYLYLYATPESEDPFALLEIGPRGGVKRTNL